MKFTQQEVYEATLRSFRVPGHCKDTPKLSENIQHSSMGEAIGMKFFRGIHNPTSRPFDGSAVYPGHIIDIPHEVKVEHAYDRTPFRQKRWLRGESSFGNVIMEIDGEKYPNWAVVKRLHETNPVIINMGYYGNDLQYIMRYRYNDSYAHDHIKRCLDDLELGNVNLNVPKVDYKHWDKASPEIWLMPWRDTSVFSPRFKKAIDKYCKINVYAGQYELPGQSMFAAPYFETAKSASV